jgi:hypothetical protein
MAKEELVVRMHEVAEALETGEITFPDFHDWLIQKFHFGSEPQIYPDEEVTEALKRLSQAIVIALKRDEQTWIEKISYRLGFSIATGNISPNDLSCLIKNRLEA